VLVECGFVRAVASDGGEWTFTPSLARIAALGDPHEIVALYASLHGPHAAQTAAYVLAGLCDQDDPSPLIGWHEEVAQDGGRPCLRWHVGQMPEAEQVVIARHLMQHGIVGKAKPEQQGSGKYSERFDASEYIAAARAHLGLSSADAEALSMTEFQTMLEMKFPDAMKAGKRDVPTREEYDAQMAAYATRREREVSRV
jgi:hypothetical protein